MLRHYVVGLLVFLCSVVLAVADAKRDYPFSDFIRVSKPEGSRLPISYDTAIAKFIDEKNNVEVHLVGAIHIGDKAYYGELNEIFKRYDAVLYELVAEENTKPSSRTEKNESNSLLASLQSGMGEALALEHQLKYIDYHAKNMIHADMNATEFARRVSDRGDIVQVFYRAMILGVKKSGGDAQKEEMKMQGRILGALFASDPALSLKRTIAEQMINQLDEAGWLIGGDEGSAIITDRNAVALSVLRREIRNGKKKIAIFYGAAHLPEFARSLEKEFQMKYLATDWVIAWDLTKDKSAREKKGKKESVHEF